ncbi:tellurite resistance TerB family protein [Marinoscillum furvescens]|uniref:Tellurite resistance protein TerB n=1 Tax=Marinoscillum furvescens DSM 4134 TaxID=1122208 RepID=A0A3D9L4P6_MARFU|nr:hypothetical protein [Marinoscillum furvescens]RED98986.1 hypothetical protein C7460_109180 [Marinoscillum furvescens DSM 4134]
MNSDLTNISPTFYGISLVPKGSWRAYGYALLTIAGSDGIVSDPELEWLTLDMAKEVGVDEEIIADWEEFDFENSDLEDHFATFNSSALASFNKLLIYDAIRMSSADGDYALEEKEQVNEAARILKVSPEVVVAIEALVDLERAADKLRLTIL